MIYLLKSFKKKLKIIVQIILNQITFFLNFLKILIYLLHRKPFGFGYDEYKWFRIKKKIENKNKAIEDLDALGVDERIVEYKWIINELSEKKGNLLDAGSTLNFKPIIEKLKNFNIIIQTLYPETNNFLNYSVNYVYSDLKKNIFRENYFDFITCISTLEHVGFDNAHYNYYNNNFVNSSTNNSKDYLKVIQNFKFILKKGGDLYLTLPFGKKQLFNHLQQFDSEEIKILVDTFSPESVSKTFYIYKNFGWLECKEEDCKDIKFRTLDEKNPTDRAASARSVIFLKIRK